MTDDNHATKCQVLSMHTGQEIDFDLGAEYSAGLIEEILARAQSGEVVGVVIVARYRDGGATGTSWGMADCDASLGALFREATAMARRIDRD